jgi:hypothetical protein
MIINITPKLFLDLSTEWSQLFAKYNWYTFTLINIYFENDDMALGYEFVFTLVGFTLRIRYNTDKALAQFEEWEREDGECMTLEEFKKSL